MLSPLIRRYTWNSTWLYYIRIFIALCGTTALPWWLGDVKLTIPLTLGMVAAALTDLDDRLAGRLRNLIITLICFFIASASVELLFSLAVAICVGLNVIHQRVYSVGRTGATLCHHRVRRVTHCHLYDAGYLFIRSLVSATTAPAGRRSMV